MKYFLMFVRYTWMLNLLRYTVMELLTVLLPYNGDIKNRYGKSYYSSINPMRINNGRRLHQSCHGGAVVEMMVTIALATTMCIIIGLVYMIGLAFGY